MSSCHVCRGPLSPVRRSRRWLIDVGRCRACGTVSAIDAAGIVAADLGRASSDGETDWGIYDKTMHTDEDVRYEVLDALRDLLGARPDRPLLFDVGAGTGAFLDMARTTGFRIAGNDISRSAIRYAADRYGITLSSAGVEEQPAQSVDAITMWCVIAHVGDPRSFLLAARRMLRPGGILFLRTPRWCAVDAVGEAVARATSGRVAQLPDQRVTRGHLHLYRDQGMERLLRDLGYADITVEPVAHTGCTGAEIASRLGGPKRLERSTSRVIDRAMASGRAPHNTMFVYARRPQDHEEAPGAAGSGEPDF